jgi:predicted amidohydrolase
MMASISDAELIILPEMWNTGFTMKAQLYADNAEVALAKMKEWSTLSKAAMIGSIIVKENGNYYNRLYFVDGDQIISHYDKRHLFAYSGEDRSFKAGDSRCIVDFKSWRLCLNICYDLRFPVWSRNYEDYDLLIYIANWPDKRVEAWQALLKARAIENQAYCIGCNCFGEDAWHNRYGGFSQAYAYDGRMITDNINSPAVFNLVLKKEEQLSFRKSFPFLKDRDDLSAIKKV